LRLDSLFPSWNAKKTKPLVHAGCRAPDYVLGVPQI
jgi:hypothetical protein